jgi:hypothetical protein
VYVEVESGTLRLIALDLAELREDSLTVDGTTSLFLDAESRLLSLRKEANVQAVKQRNKTNLNILKILFRIIKRTVEKKKKKK